MDDARTKARDAACAFISDPNRRDDVNPCLVVVGLANMLFPRLEIDWDAVGMIADAVVKMED